MKESDLGKIYRDGEIICREGDPGKEMYVIQSGRVEVSKNTPDGEVVLSVLEDGDFFGEMALFDKLPRSVTVRALGNTHILSMDRTKFFSKASEDPSFVFNLLRGMSMRIRSLDEELSRMKKSDQP